MTKKILVVDDEPDNAELAKTILERSGYKVDIAYSGSECLRMLEENNFGLVFLDIMMPGMSGWDVFNCIREKYGKKIKVVFLSVIQIPEEKKRDLMKKGLAGYITKPYTKDDLLKIIKKILES